MISPLAAAKAYASAQGGMGVGGATDLGGAAGAGGSFADVLKGVMTDAIQATRTAETQMAAGVQGKADLVNVVTAISSAESSLETMMAVRDQVISAYQEIMRMPI
jgi:flagellar hook-basal body complex protein FliE